MLEVHNRSLSLASFPSSSTARSIIQASASTRSNRSVRLHQLQGRLLPAESDGPQREKRARTPAANMNSSTCLKVARSNFTIGPGAVRMPKYAKPFAASITAEHSLLSDRSVSAPSRTRSSEVGTIPEDANVPEGQSDRHRVASYFDACQPSSPALRRDFGPARPVPARLIGIQVHRRPRRPAQKAHFPQGLCPPSQRGDARPGPLRGLFREGASIVAGTAGFGSGVRSPGAPGRILSPVAPWGNAAKPTP